MIEPTANASYKKLLGMEAISFVIMYSVMFMNVSSWDHIYLSVTRTYMSLLMVSPMVLLMLYFMKSMYRNKKLNIIAILVSVSVFVLSFFGLRNQWFVSDREYMMAMIPHHSSAILTSEQASLKNNQVKDIAKSIIDAQKQEIQLMKQLLNDRYLLN